MTEVSVEGRGASTTQENAADPYPSRFYPEPRVLPRKDPVLYGGNRAEGPLREAELSFFKKNGYLFLENFFTGEDFKRLEDHLDRLLAECRGSDAPEVILEPEGNEVRSVFAVHRDNAMFAELSRDPRLTERVAQILGSEVYVHQSRINFKPGFIGKEFDWHSDFETWHVEDGMPRMRAVSCSIALTDNYAFNGPLMIIPGSHQEYISCVGATPKNNYKSSLQRQVYGVPDRDNLSRMVQANGLDLPTGPKGSVLLFDCNVMHGSNSNITPYPRSNIFMVYNSVENKLVAPYSGQQPRPEYIGHRLYTR